jgi:hypothetical protein
VLFAAVIEWAEANAREKAERDWAVSGKLGMRVVMRSIRMVGALTGAASTR